MTRKSDRSNSREYDGIYEYTIKDFQRNELRRYNVPCKILDETGKSYFIKILYPTKFRTPDQKFWVRKKSVYRSYRNNITLLCDKYNLVVSNKSCRAYLVRCFRKEELKGQEHDSKD